MDQQKKTNLETKENSKFGQFKGKHAAYCLIQPSYTARVEASAKGHLFIPVFIVLKYVIYRNRILTKPLVFWFPGTQNLLVYFLLVFVPIHRGVKRPT